MTEEIALRIAKELYSTLCSVHEHGICHNDIKPSNIFLDHDVE